MKKLIVLLCSCFVGISAIFAQVDEVTLVVSGEGESLDKATTMALRSAIEQAFGTFVSANTTILNDELVKDEIVSISSGNIKKYDILNSYDKDNGNVFVTLQAIVSVKAMTAYAQSKGAECEFAGATIGQQVKLAQLNREAEKKAFENLLSELRQIAPYMFDFKLQVSEPEIHETEASIGLTVQIMANENYKAFNNLLTTTMVALARDPQNDNTHMLKKECYSIRYPNPIYEEKGKKKNRSLIGVLFSPIENVSKDCYFYNTFPLDSIQMLISFAAEHFFIYDNTYRLYLFEYGGALSNVYYSEAYSEAYTKIKSRGSCEGWLRSININRSQCNWLFPMYSSERNYTDIDYTIDFLLNPKEGKYTRGYTYVDATYNKDVPLLETSLRTFRVPIEDVAKISKISISKETIEFVNICERIEPDNLSAIEWLNFYATSLCMEYVDVFPQNIRFIPICCQKIRRYHPFRECRDNDDSCSGIKEDYCSLLTLMKIMSQEMLDLYNNNDNYRNAILSRYYWYDK